ncbi:MAG: L,D-transpeptidase family protein [Candidatus Thiodiazotropha sp. (ex Epidulcina cf. delphinae)]|nr:L,D-transpeptidase family protein [Candidatus Thiodiazotropha sp. (ex Epidulcina cf. delphinae)]
MLKRCLIISISIILIMVYSDTIHPKLFHEIIENANQIVVYKGQRRLSLFKDGRHVKSYPISLGINPVGHKKQEGDGKTPEGIYLIDWKHPNSSYHKALRISYPNYADRRDADKRGVSPGGDIMIHGLPNGLGWLYPLFIKSDWTEGCIAVSNTAMEEIVSSVKTGTQIVIKP